MCVIPNLFKYLSLTTVLITSTALAADPLAEARALIADNDPLGAKEALRPLFDNNAATRLSGEANYLMGLCGFLEGDFNSSLQYFENARQKGIPEADLYIGRLEYMNYDFDKAQNLFEKFKKGRKLNETQQSTLDLFETQLEEGRRALDHVQQLKVIDKQQIPSTDFWKYIKLPSSAGKLLPPDSIPFEQGRTEAIFAYANEAGDYMMWCQSDNNDNYRIVESTRLIDGNWTTPHTLPENIGDGKDSDFPFLRSDGVTLYFAAGGEKSIGGMDIFVATRDPQSGEYLQPANLGMPFNSPYDDIFLAVDEENNIGWLVSDREQLGDRLTLYVYLLEENRVNFDPEAEDLIDRARIADSDILPEDDPLRKEKLQDVANIGKYSEIRKDFTFRLPGGREIHTLKGFSSPESRYAANQYFSALKSFENDMLRLGKLRREYSEMRKKNGGKENSAIAAKASLIRELEKSTAEGRKQLKALRSKIISLELPSRVKH